MKNIGESILTAVIVGSVLTPLAKAAESASVLLQKGIFAEETEGNLDAAIKVYEQIAAEAAASRTLVAQAQYRLAVCYQKNGKKDQAIKILNALLQQFPSDAALNPKARRTLAELGATPPEAISVRQVPLPPTATGGWMMSLSPDGRLLAHEPTG
jgi:tetratricopeptide (TPR) repeat protein